MKTRIYRVAVCHDDKVGNDFIITQSNLDTKITFDEVYVIDEKTHEWVYAKSVADLDNGNYAKIKNSSFRGLLSNIALHTPVSDQPKTYFIEKEADHG